MWPPKRDECSRSPQWPSGRDILNGQGVLGFAGNMQEVYAAGVFAGTLISSNMSVIFRELLPDLKEFPA